VCVLEYTRMRVVRVGCRTPVESRTRRSLPLVEGFSSLWGRCSRRMSRRTNRVHRFDSGSSSTRVGLSLFAAPRQQLGKRKAEPMSPTKSLLRALRRAPHEACLIRTHSDDSGSPCTNARTVCLAAAAAAATAAGRRVRAGMESWRAAGRGAGVGHACCCCCNGTRSRVASWARAGVSAFGAPPLQQSRLC
jgi:hypothetical protein